MKSYLGTFVFLLLGFLSCVSAGIHYRQSFDPLKFILGNDNLGPLKNGILGQAEAPSPASDLPRVPLILAGNRTRRPDVLDGFKTYEGGWDVSNKHYWASVGYTGTAGFVLAVIWLVFFGVALLVHHCFVWRIDFQGKGSAHSQRIRMILLIFFTFASMVGCILLFVGQDKFHGEALHALNYVVNQSDYTSQMLRNVTDYLSLAKSIDVPQLKLPESVMQDIDDLSARLSSGADTLTEKTDENYVKVRRVLNTVQSILISVAALMLFMGILGLVLSPLNCQRAIHIFVFSGWILVAVTLTILGISVILDSAILDSSVAMREWVENPQAETTLSNILPCVDERSTNQKLLKSRKVIGTLVNYINSVIYTEANTNRPPSDQFYYNQSGPLMPTLCFPYDDQMQDRNCSAQEVSLTNASAVWERYICRTSLDLKTCASPGRLTPRMYSQLVLGVNASYVVLHYTPALLDLQNCNLVRDAFMTITSRFCPQLEHYLIVVEAGLGLISAGIALCLILWLVYANHPQTKGESVQPDNQEGCPGCTKDRVVNMVSVVVGSPARVAPEVVHR